MSSRPTIVLRDTNPEMALAWTQRLAHLDGVTFGVGDLLTADIDAIVSPANSFGYMDGGIDLAYRNLFGVKIEVRLKELISRREEEELPVGAAVVVPTGHDRITRMISAPTMRYPSPIVGTDNVYRATKAALRVLPKIEPPVERLGFPGMGTGIGCMDPFDAADQMRQAFEEWMNPAQSNRRL